MKPERFIQPQIETAVHWLPWQVAVCERRVAIERRRSEACHRQPAAELPQPADLPRFRETEITVATDGVALIVVADEALAAHLVAQPCVQERVVDPAIEPFAIASFERDLEAARATVQGIAERKLSRWWQSRARQLAVEAKEQALFGTVEKFHGQSSSRTDLLFERQAAVRCTFGAQFCLAAEAEDLVEVWKLCVPAPTESQLRALAEIDAQKQTRRDDCFFRRAETINAHAADQRHPIAPHPPRILCVIALLQSLFPIIHQWRQARLRRRKLNSAAIRAAHPSQRDACLHQMRLMRVELPVAAPAEQRALPGVNLQARRIGVRVIVLQREDTILPMRAAMARSSIAR